jgi:hypothetical protein
MPADQGGRLDDHQSLAPVKEARRRAQREAISRCGPLGFLLVLLEQSQLPTKKDILGGKRRTTTKEPQTESRSVCSYDLQRLGQLAQLLIYAWHAEIFSQLHARFFNTFQIFADQRTCIFETVIN